MDQKIYFVQCNCEECGEYCYLGNINAPDYDKSRTPIFGTFVMVPRKYRIEFCNLNIAEHFANAVNFEVAEKFRDEHEFNRYKYKVHSDYPVKPDPPTPVLTVGEKFRSIIGKYSLDFGQGVYHQSYNFRCFLEKLGQFCQFKASKAFCTFMGRIAVKVDPDRLPCPKCGSHGGAHFQCSMSKRMTATQRRINYKNVK